MLVGPSGRSQCCPTSSLLRRQARASRPAYSHWLLFCFLEVESPDVICQLSRPLSSLEIKMWAKPTVCVSSNVSVDADSAQRGIHEATGKWKSPTQAWTKYHISAQARKKTLERNNLPKGRVRQGIFSTCILYTIMLRFFHAYAEQDYAPRCTFSTLALKHLGFPRLRWNLHDVSLATDGAQPGQTLCICCG